MTYEVLDSDVDFEAFLSTITPEQAIADLSATFSPPEVEQAKFLAARSQIIRRRTNQPQTAVAITMARIMAHGA
jgi:hypothetical protein